MTHSTPSDAAPLRRLILPGVYALKRLVETEYCDFAAEIETFPDLSDEFMLLWESMDCDDI